MADVACGRPRGGFVRDFFAFDGADAIVCGFCEVSPSGCGEHEEVHTLS